MDNAKPVLCLYELNIQICNFSPPDELLQCDPLYALLAIHLVLNSEMDHCNNELSTALSCPQFALSITMLIILKCVEKNGPVPHFTWFNGMRGCSRQVR